MSPSEDDFITTSHTRTVELARAGDNEAFDSLDHQYRSEIYRYLVGLVGTEGEAQDLVQETMTKAWQKLPTLQNVTLFRPWLYAIARNSAYDLLRQRQQLRKKIFQQSWEDLKTDDVAATTPGPQGYTIEAEFLRWALAEIPEKYRDCLLLQTIGGFSQSEVAELTGISKESVRTYVSNARRQLREIYQRLGEEFDEEERGGPTHG